MRLHNRLVNKNLLSADCIYRNMLRGNERKKTNTVWVLALRNTHFSWDFKEFNAFI